MADGEPVKVFGLGCFVFEVVPDEGQTSFEVSWWRDELLAALGGISSISSVTVEVDFDELLDGKWRFDSTNDQRPVFQEFLPNPRGSRVAFDIVIPKRLHPDLLDGQTYGAERFRVETVYEFFGPATVVTCLDGDEDTDGSLAVRLLWRFLKSEFQKHTKSLKFTNLGPSPFHAYFRLREGKPSQPGVLEWRELSRFGYAEIEVAYDPDSFTSIDEAHRHTTAVIADELSLFYLLTIQSNYEQMVSAYLAHQTAELMKMHTARGLKASTRRIFRTGPTARALGLEALGFKLELANRRTGSMQAIADLYHESSVISVLREQVDEACTTEMLPEVETALEVVRFAEGSRGKELEIAVISASTLFGGAAGAIAAIVAGP